MLEFESILLAELPDSITYSRLSPVSWLFERESSCRLLSRLISTGIWPEQQYRDDRRWFIYYSMIFSDYMDGQSELNYILISISHLSSWWPTSKIIPLTKGDGIRFHEYWRSTSGALDFSITYRMWRASVEIQGYWIWLDASLYNGIGRNYSTQGEIHV